MGVVFGRPMALGSPGKDIRMIYKRMEQVIVQVNAAIGNPLKEYIQVEAAKYNTSIQCQGHLGIVLFPDSHFVVNVDNAVVVLVLVFEVAGLYDRECLCRTGNDIAFIPEETNSL